MSEERVLELLEEAYFDELESLMNYLAAARNLETFDGVDLGEDLLVDVDDELAHAKALSHRIDVLGGRVPGSEGFGVSQPFLQPREDPTDVVAIIEGSIEAESDAISTYQELAEVALDVGDHVTYELATTHLEDEEEHKREMQKLLRSFD